MCSATALGLALALPNRKVIALDADGNLTLNLGVLGTVANERPKNLTVIVMDNGNYLGSHQDEPGMPTATCGKMNLEGVVRQCGIASSSIVETLNCSGTKCNRHSPSPVRISWTPESMRSIATGHRKLNALPIRDRTSINLQTTSRKAAGVQIIGGGLGNFG